MFLFLLLRDQNINQNCKIGVVFNTSSARSSLWLYFSTKIYEKKALGKKFRVCTRTNRFFSKKIKFFYFNSYSFESQILAIKAKFVSLKRPVTLDKLFGYLLAELNMKKKLKGRSPGKVL